MPFRYVTDTKTGEPILPEGMRELLRCVLLSRFEVRREGKLMRLRAQG